MKATSCPNARQTAGLNPRPRLTSGGLECMIGPFQRVDKT